MKKTSNKILGGFLLLIAIVGLAFLIFVKAKGTAEYQRKTEISINNQKVEVKITSSISKNELEEIAIQLKNEKNIEFDYSKSKFKNNDKIYDLIVRVDCNDGYKGTIETNEVALRMVSFGFIRDYSEDAEVPFICGQLISANLD